MMLFSFAALFLISQATAEPVKYHGHKVFKIFPKNAMDSQYILNMVEKYGLDIWRKYHNDNSLDVHIYPEVLDTITQELNNINVPFSTWIHDVQTLIDRQFDRNTSHVQKRAVSKPMEDDLTIYHTYDEIMRILNDNETIDGSGPSGDAIKSQNQDIGYTAEGRVIKLTKIYKASSTTKRAIFVDGGIHAREWISPAFLLYLYNQLKYNPSKSTEVESLVDMYDWYLVPVLNPDGYVYSHVSDRLWRKNRQQNFGSSCHGVDLNRNFGYMWNPAIGGSTSPCSDVYSGTGAFSEAESKAVRDFLNNGIDFISYLTVHSYGQYWLYPWGYTSALPADVQDLDDAAGVAIQKLRERHNTRYTKGSSTNTLYAAAGGSDDYAKGGAGIKYSYTLELRDTGRYGFVLPTSLILPTCEETMDAFIAYAQYLNTRNTKQYSVNY